MLTVGFIGKEEEHFIEILSAWIALLHGNMWKLFLEYFSL
jgi:hypothetical protein